jgi:hypothetical protein
MRLALTLIVCVALLAGRVAPIEHISTMLGGVAEVTSQASRATSNIIGAGADLIETSEKAVVALSSSSLNLLDEVWQGVDLTDVTFAHSHGRVAVASAAHFATWMRESATEDIYSLSTAEQEVLQHVVNSLDLALPHIENGITLFKYESSYVDFRAEGKVLSSGYLTFKWLWRRIQFAPRWSNPLWEAISVDMSKAKPFIKKRLDEVLETMPQPEVWWIVIESTSLATADLPPLAWARTTAWLRWWRLMFRWVVTSVLRVLWST